MRLRRYWKSKWMNYTEVFTAWRKDHMGRMRSEDFKKSAWIAVVFNNFNLRPLGIFLHFFPFPVGF